VQPLVEALPGLSAPAAFLLKPVEGVVEELAPGAQQRGWLQPEGVELQALAVAELPDPRWLVLQELQGLPRGQALAVAVRVVPPASGPGPELLVLVAVLVLPWAVAVQPQQVWSASHWLQAQFSEQPEAPQFQLQVL
jgi:hypothetical protein